MDVEKVVTQYQTSLRAFLLSRVRDPSDVDDVLQEILLKTFRNLHTLKSEEKIKPWLFQIAKNEIIDHYRRKKRGMTIEAKDLWYDDPVETQAHAFENCVEPFLKALPSEAGDLLRAIEIHGVSQKECAERLGISYSTLKSRVQASRKQLRQLFDQFCDIAFAADGSILNYSRKSTGCDTC